MKNLLSLLFLFALIACKKDPVQNLPPVAKAGDDMTLTLPLDSIGLDGGPSYDPDGAITAFLWTQVSGPVGCLIDTEASAATVVRFPGAGVYQFQLKVTDEKGATATDDVQVTVLVDPDGDPPAYGTPFDGVPAVENMVMYEVNLRAFSATGDFQGVIQRLDSIKALGINVIWLMPIHPIGEINSVNSPYSVQHYKEVNPEFGTLDDLRSLVELAHQKGMAVILDWVANHTSWDNPWISHTDWYSQDGAGNIIIPPGTNWQDVADLNFDNAEMRLAMISALKYWVLTANIDGFRMDAADLVPFSFWQQAIDTLESMPGRDPILLAEGNRTDHFTAGFQMNFSWNYYTALKNVFNNNAPASSLFSANLSEYSGIPAGKKKLRFTTNHDESAWDATPMTLFHGKQGALAASVMASYLNGVPLLYSSQEVGRVFTLPFFSNSPINWTQNSDMVQAYRDMFALYHSSEALRKGNIQAFPDPDIMCFTKTSGSESVLVMVNARDQTTTYTLPAALADTSWNDAFTQSPVQLFTTLSLDPYEYVVLKSQ